MPTGERLDRFMRHAEQLERVGKSAAGVLRKEETWIHRRVESLAFPIPDTPTVRRRVSIDFSIPTGLEPIDAAPSAHRPPRFYVPLSILRKWPPLDRLDLFGEDGRSIPFLTGRQNRTLDAAVLLEMAEALVREQLPGTALTDQEKREIRRVALSAGPAAADALAGVCPSYDAVPDGAGSPMIETLRSDKTFSALARTLCDQTILWLRTEGEHEDREIVKFAYDLPWEGSGESFGRASFGLEPFRFEFATPHVGATGSYHLHLETPPALQVLAAELVLFDQADAAELGEPIKQESVRYRAMTSHPVHAPHDGFEAFVDAGGPNAKFYVSGHRRGLAGRVYVSVKLNVAGFLRSVSLGSLLIAAVIGAFAWKSNQTLKNDNSAVAVLVVVPALLAYLLRPSEHVLVGGLLVGLRRLVILGGVWPLLAAVLVVVISSATVLQFSLLGLAALEALTGLALAAPLVWPARSDL